MLSSEREGLRQVEGAIREIQGVVEGTQPQNRRATIHRLEAELDGLRNRVTAIDAELDEIALAHLTKVGPRGETPAELAKRIVAEREAFRWFVDRPVLFAAETALDEKEVAALFAARIRCGDLIDHLHVTLPSPADLPDAADVAGWHNDLVAAAEHHQAAAGGPVRNLKVTPANTISALACAHMLDSLRQAYQSTTVASWLDPFRRARLSGSANVWCDRLQELLSEWTAVDFERAQLMRRSVTIPAGLIDHPDAREAILAASGQRLWSLMSRRKGAAKGLVAEVRINGGSVKDDDAVAWQHVQAVILNLVRQRELRAQWDAFAAEVGAPLWVNAKPSIELAKSVLKICDDARANASSLSAVISNEFATERLANDPSLCEAISNQIRAATTSIRLAAAEQHRQRLLNTF